MSVRLQYLGTASVLVELAGLRLLSDPALDPPGTRYDFGPWYAPAGWFGSEKLEAPAALPDGPIDVALVSHDHHADNLDPGGRRLIASGRVRRVVTTEPCARRLSSTPARDELPGAGLDLSKKTTGLAWGESTQEGPLKITATPARHGPVGTPRVHEVAGFLLEAEGAPTVWLSGDTVLFDPLARWCEAHRGTVDVAVIHAGGVRFPHVPVLGRALFTFDAAQVVALLRLLEPRLVVPVHREGWVHFREPVQELKAALEGAGFGERVRLLELGASLAI